MKHFYYIISFLFCSCSANYFEVNTVSDNNLFSDVLSFSNTQKYYIVDHSIKEADVSSVVQKYFPDKVILKTTPIEEDGKTVLYIANFNNGWAIIAGDDRVDSQIIAYGEDGSFILSDIENQELLCWLEITKKKMHLIQSIDDVHINDTNAAVAKRDEEPYYWLGYYLGTTRGIDTTEVDHLLDTKWCQNSPWNAKCPANCPAGCLPVATGQILYYLQMHKNFSIGLYHTVIPSFSLTNNGYVFNNIVLDDYNEPSSRWAAMAKVAVDTNTVYVADLLVDIGYRYGLHYTPSESGADYIEPVFGTFNVSFTSSNFYFSVVKNNLDNGFPVMVGAYRYPEYNSGHAWVIDGYQSLSSYKDDSYLWRVVASDSLHYYSGSQYCYTEAQKQQYYPDAIEGEIYHVVDTTKWDYLRMTWGRNDVYDDGYYAMVDYHWPASWTGNPYQYNPWISYDFWQEQQDEN